MRKMDVSEQKNVVGGRTWYHWICNAQGFMSTSYSTCREALKNGRRHEKRYPGHGIRIITTH